mmetsp:Transcript_10511/g.23880  ORF Transcript_10511/g.23880 Transcript_10511/m.23880 type:complete len:339 (-) Transcript_10511:47-1063(-)
MLLFTLLVGLTWATSVEAAQDSPACLLSVASALDKIAWSEEATAPQQRQSANESDAVSEPTEEVPERLKEMLCPFAAEQLGMKEDAINMLVSTLPDLKNASRRSQLSARFHAAKTCAVVSNSGVLLRHHYGSEIDASDMVLRFNDAEIGGALQSFVGSRDDVRMLNHQSVQPLLGKRLPLENATVYLLNRHRASDWLSTVMVKGIARHNPLLHLAFGNDTILTTTARRLIVQQYGTTIHDKERLSTGVLTSGYQGVFLAMTLCDEVRAYGFPNTPMSGQSPFHYYGALQKGNASVNEEPVHRGIADHEKQLYRRLAMNSDIDATDVAIIPGFSSLRCG